MAGPEELISLEIMSVWKCQTQDLSMEKIIPKHVQLGIEMITGTRLVEDLNSQVIHVRAQCQEDCNKAVHKLDILRKYHVSIIGVIDGLLPLTSEGSCTSSHQPPLLYRGERPLRNLRQIFDGDQ